MVIRHHGVYTFFVGASEGAPGGRPVPVAGRCRPVPGRTSEGAPGGRPVPVAGQCRWPAGAGRCRPVPGLYTA